MLLLLCNENLLVKMVEFELHSEGICEKKRLASLAAACGMA